eukprot:gene26121-11839_t
MPPTAALCFNSSLVTMETTSDSAVALHSQPDTPADLTAPQGLSLPAGFETSPSSGLHAPDRPRAVGEVSETMVPETMVPSWANLPPALVRRVMVLAGVWSGVPAWNTCRAWHEHMEAQDVAECMVGGLGLQTAMCRAAQVGRHDLVTHLLQYDRQHAADLKLGMPLVAAAGHGHACIVRLLLEHHPVADGQSDYWLGHALNLAVKDGHDSVVHMILSWPRGAPAANHGDGSALVAAASSGRVSTVTWLLSWPENAPMADCRDGRALVAAAEEGHVDMVRLLLSWPTRPAHADCRRGAVLIAAASSGSLELVELLLSWHEHAPLANCSSGEALLAAAGGGHIHVVQALLSWPQHAPSANCLGGKAFIATAKEGHVDILTVLLSYPGTVSSVVFETMVTTAALHYQWPVPHGTSDLWCTSYIIARHAVHILSAYPFYLGGALAHGLRAGRVASGQGGGDLAHGLRAGRVAVTWRMGSERAGWRCPGAWAQSGQGGGDLGHGLRAGRVAVTWRMGSERAGWR